jgi:hypothetical protein
MASMLKYTRLQPSEMRMMDFFELEEILDSLKMLNEKEEEERRKKDGKEKNSMSNLNLGSLSRQMQSNSGMKMPSLPNFKL